MDRQNQADSRTFSSIGNIGVGSLGGLNAYPGAAAVGTAGPSESPSKIRDTVGATENIASELHTLLSHLESRLDSALTPQPPTPDQNTPKNPTPIASSLLERLYRVNDSLGYAMQRVELLRQRVEV